MTRDAEGHAEVPEIDFDAWRVSVSGAVARPLSLGWEDISALPSTRVAASIHCRLDWPFPTSAWEGVPTSEVARMAGAFEAAKHVVVRSLDGSSAMVAMADFLAPGSLLAHSWEATPLRPVDGGPLRLVLQRGLPEGRWIAALEFVA